MAKLQYNRQKVTRQAHIFTMLGVPFKEAMRESWKAEKLRVLKKMLKSGIVEFSFKEASGKLERALGTTAPPRIPSKDHGTRPSGFSTTSIEYYDLDRGKWRSVSDILSIGSS